MSLTLSSLDALSGIAFGGQITAQRPQRSPGTEVAVERRVRLELGVGDQRAQVDAGAVLGSQEVQVEADVAEPRELGRPLEVEQARPGPLEVQVGVLAGDGQRAVAAVLEPFGDLPGGLLGRIERQV